MATFVQVPDGGIHGFRNDSGEPGGIVNDTSGPRQPAAWIPDTVRFWLHVEGAAALIAAAAIYDQLGGSWIWAVPLMLLPDLSMVGYLAGPRLGSFTYNLVHNFAVGLAVLGLGAWLDSYAVMLGGAVLIGHVGGDRLLGYGLKHVTTFRDTHIQHA